MGQCRYAGVLREREGSDRLVQNEAQTLNLLQKAKETQTEARSTSTAECQVNARGGHYFAYFATSMAQEGGRGAGAHMYGTEQTELCVAMAKVRAC